MHEPTGDPKPKRDPHKRMLEAIFQKDKLLSTGFEAGEGDTEGMLVQRVTFPPFEKTLKPLDHASHVQINEAFLEGLYAVMAGLRLGTIPSEDPGFVDVLNAPHVARIVKQETAFESPMSIGDTVHFTYTVTHVAREEEDGKFRYRVSVSVEGPSRAVFECLVTPQTAAE